MNPEPIDRTKLAYTDRVPAFSTNVYRALRTIGGADGIEKVWVGSSMLYHSPDSRDGSRDGSPVYATFPEAQAALLAEFDEWVAKRREELANIKEPQ